MKPDLGSLLFVAAVATTGGLNLIIRKPDRRSPIWSA